MPQLTNDHLNRFCKRHSYFVETGTYEGDTVKTAINFGFKHIHSVEIESNIYKKACERFKNHDNVTIWNGDSPDILRNYIIPSLDDRAAFWLDAHRSTVLNVPGSDKYGRSALLHELDAISESSIKNHTIIADDVRLFDTIGWDFLKKEDYINKLMTINPNYNLIYLDGGFSYGRQFPEKDILVAYIPDDKE